MPLIPATLIQGFLALAKNKPKDRVKAAQEWARIYDEYAQAAMTANGGKLIFTGTERAKLQAVLMVPMLLPVGLPPTLAASWGAGLAAYWGAPPILTTPAPIPVAPFTVPGICVPPIGIPVLIPALTALYAIPAGPEEVFAVQQATLLDACTRTVLVTFAPGGAFPLI